MVNVRFPNQLILRHFVRNHSVDIVNYQEIVPARFLEESEDVLKPEGGCALLNHPPLFNLDLVCALKMLFQLVEPLRVEYLVGAYHEAPVLVQTRPDHELHCKL